MHRALSAVGLLATCAAAASAQQYSNDFNFADPRGAQLFGAAALAGGALLVTPDSNFLDSATILPIAAQNLRAFHASFTYGYHTTDQFTADGISFNLGVLPDGVVSLESENGPGNGLTVAIDIFDFNSNNDGAAKGIRVFQNGVQLAAVQLNLPNSIPQTPVEITLDLDGTIDVSFAGNLVVNNLSTGFVPQTGQRFGIAGRTGGFRAAQIIDDLVVTPRYQQSSCTDPQAIRGDGIFGYFVGTDTTPSQPGASCAQTTQPIWFCWQAPLTGFARVSTVGLATHDSVLTAFDGCAPCPSAFGELACNDDFGSLQSQVDIPTVAGATYLVRVSDFGSPTSDIGPHAFSITSTEGCRADFNNDGNIDPDDLGDFINAFFGGCP